jgi:hypothetical protein
MADGGWSVLMKISGEKILDFLPHRILKARFKPKRIQEGVHVFAVGYGPQFYVQKAGNSCSLETLNLKVVNCLPFSIDLESIQASIVLEGFSLGDLKQPLSLRVQSQMVGDLQLRQELTEKQADLIRNYGSQTFIFKLGGQLTFRSPFERHQIVFHIEIRSIAYI